MWIMYAYEAARGPTLKDAKATLRALGMSINKNQWGEYRVNFLGGDEAGAYYTDDLEDAVNTGKHMAGVRPVKLMPNPEFDTENPMSKHAKMALWIGGGVAVAGIAAYFIFSKSSTTTGATGGTGPSGTQTGGTQKTGGTGPSGYHFVGPVHYQPYPINYFGGGQPQQNNPPPNNQPQPAPSPIVVQNGDSQTYQAPAANSMVLIQLPQYSSVGTPSWTGSGSPSSLGAATSGGVPTLQLIMPGGPGTLTVPWTDNTDNSQGSATITFV